MLKLNLPEYNYKIKQKEGKLYIWDRIRRKFVFLSPEEWVRQHYLHYLTEEKQVPAGRISLEYGQQYNTLSKRIDILVWDNALRPLLLVECKAPHVPITESTLLQLSAYNSQHKAQWLALTNGMHTQYMQLHNGSYIHAPELELHP